MLRSRQLTPLWHLVALKSLDAFFPRTSIALVKRVSFRRWMDQHPVVAVVSALSGIWFVLFVLTVVAKAMSRNHCP